MSQDTIRVQVFEGEDQVHIWFPRSVLRRVSAHGHGFVLSGPEASALNRAIGDAVCAPKWESEVPVEVQR